STTTPPPPANTGPGGNTSSGSVAPGSTPSGFGAGTGVFVDATANLPVSALQDYAADAGDLDGDGDVDIAIAAQGTDSRVLFNDGQGRFSIRAGAFPTISMNARDVRLIDVENDG